MRRVGGEVSPALALDLRLRLGRRSKGILHNRRKLRQLQDSEPSSQRVDFDRSTGRFAAATRRQAFEVPLRPAFD